MTKTAYIHAVIVRKDWEDPDGLYDMIERIVTSLGYKCRKYEDNWAIDAQTEMEYNEDEVKKILVLLDFIPRYCIRVMYTCTMTVDEFVNEGV